MKVRVFIGRSDPEDLDGLRYRYARTAASPEAYRNYSAGQLIVVSGVHTADSRKIVGRIVEILNDPENDSRDFFVELPNSEFELLTSDPTSEWELIEQK